MPFYDITRTIAMMKPYRARASAKIIIRKSAIRIKACISIRSKIMV